MSSNEQHVQRGAANRNLLLAFVWALAVIAVVHKLDFPGSVPDFKAVTNGAQLLDTSPSFDVNAVHDRLESYGELGRANYRFRLWTIDVLLPLSVTPLLFLWMRRAVDRMNLAGAVRQALLVFTLFYLAFDLAENASLFALLSGYPSRDALLATVLPYVSAVKRSSLLVAVLAPAALLVLANLRQRFQKRAPT